MREFLFSDRLAAGRLSHFALNRWDVCKDYLGAVLKECRKPNLPNLPKDSPDIDFSKYCHWATRKAIIYAQELIVRNDDLWKVQLEFYMRRPSKRRGIHLDFEAYIEHESSPEPLSHWLKSVEFPNSRKAQILLSMMKFGRFDMINRYLSETSLQSLWNSSLFITSAKGCRTHTNFLELVGAIHTRHRGRIRDIIVTALRNSISSTISLYLMLAGHSCGESASNRILCTPSHSCILEKYLRDEGADPNGIGFKVTPLQVAASRWDYEAMEILLGAGADPNRLGEERGENTPHVDEGMGSWSALHILRNSEPNLDYQRVVFHRKFDRTSFIESRRSERYKAEELLVREL